MLIKLVSKDVIKYWGMIKEALARTLAGPEFDTEEKKNNVLRAILSHRLACWFYKKDNKIQAIVLTSIIKDDFMQTKNLLLYAVYTIASDANVWFNAFDTIEKYAKGCGCTKVLFYTRNEKILKIAKHLGLRRTYTMGEFDL